ncbi:Putative mycofactocin radical SAM maturase MftC [Methanosarcinales archaeon]|nr:radical SAM protein [Candidatus Methanoperedens sp.]CAG0959229.1 Putative mycofactocin radical SAM maturase MftC [Methanosarcinales archaeon]
MPSNDLYPVLAPGHTLRNLEAPFVYYIPDDQLYELDDEAFEFLKKCDGKTPFPMSFPDAGSDKGAIEFMLDEGIILMQDSVHPRIIKVEGSSVPSLRYLLLNITNKCNLSCKHCYLGKSGNVDIEVSRFEKTVSKFESMGGLKLMISGGEPLMHSGFWELMEVLPSYELRKVILSNGTLIGQKEAKKLSEYIDEVQVSIDGIRSHDILRGVGSYEKAMRGVTNLQSFNIPVSIATMAHKYNAEEFDEMQKLFSGMNIISWSVDVPCMAGNLKDNQDIMLDLKKAASHLRYGFGAGAHESTGNYTCGSHLCAVSPDGTVSKCGFFEDEPAGNIDDLRAAHDKLCKDYLWTLDKLDCHDCEVIHDCRGGCRFRARQHGGILAPDPLLCYANGVLTHL